MSRFRSIDPESVQLSSGVSTLRQGQHSQMLDLKRSGRPRSSARYIPDYDDDDTSVASETDHALTGHHINPYQESSSLRHGGEISQLSEHQHQQQQENDPKNPLNGDACAYYFWAISFSIFVLAVLNFLILIVIVLILGIGPDGLSSIEYFPEIGSVKFLKDIWATDISLSGLISGFADEPLLIKAENGDILFQVMEATNGKKFTEMRIGKSEIVLNNVESFTIIDPQTGKVLFDGNKPSFNINENTIETLFVNEVETNRVVSPIGKDLLVQSDAGLSLVGTEGISVESKSVTLEAAENITIESNIIDITGDLLIDPLALPVGGGGYPGEKPQFKICICSKSGKLFVIPATTSTGRSNCNLGKLNNCDENNDG